MNEEQEIPPSPEDFQEVDGSIDWIAYYDAIEEYELHNYGLLNRN